MSFGILGLLSVNGFVEPGVRILGLDPAQVRLQDLFPEDLLHLLVANACALLEMYDRDVDVPSSKVEDTILGIEAQLE